MKGILLVLLLMVVSYSKAQYIGIQNTSFTIYNEIDTSRFVIRIGALIGLRSNDESLLQVKAGYKVLRFTKRKNLALIMYIPVMNYSIASRGYNTPFNAELDYKLKKIRFTIGTMIYKDKIDYYGTISIPFK